MGPIEYTIRTVTPLMIPLFALAGASVAARRTRRRGGDVAETWMRWLLVGVAALPSLWVALSFLIAPRMMAESIGFPTGSPFKFEIAFANLGFAALALLAVRRRPVRLPYAVGHGIFLWGAVAGHLIDWFARGNHAPGNTGGILLWDFGAPLAIGLLAWAMERRDARDTH